MNISNTLVAYKIKSWQRIFRQDKTKLKHTLEYETSQQFAIPFIVFTNGIIMSILTWFQKKRDTTFLEIAMQMRSKGIQKY